MTTMLKVSPERQKAIQAVIKERNRQREVEGWTIEHDDAQDSGGLFYAGRCYFKNTFDGWPYDDEWWKPKDRLRNLIRAGAFFVAELERIGRACSTMQYWRQTEEVKASIRGYRNEVSVMLDSLYDELEKQFIVET